jgi:hypothetical protein
MTYTYTYIAFCIIIIGIIFLIIFNYVSNRISNTQKNITFQLNNELSSTNSLKYYRCAEKKLNNATLTGLKNTLFTKTSDSANAELYIPCDYNYIETELANFTPSAANKYIYAIVGGDTLCGKDLLWNTLVDEHGIDTASYIMPQSWVISNPKINNNNRAEFTHYYETHRAARPAFILKKNIQGKRGLRIVDSLADIQQIITDEPAYKVIQLYLKNSYTINKRKLNIRLYVVISCHNGDIQWFLYNYGKCIYTNKAYDPVQSFIGVENISDKEQHFTSYNLNTSQVYSIEKLPESLQDLKIYLTPLIYQKQWSRICQKLSLIRAAYVSAGMLCESDDAGTYTDKVCFQLFGIDVIIDADGMMEPYILEFNKGPEMTYKSPNDDKMKPQLITDMLNMITNKVGVTESNFTVIN